MTLKEAMYLFDEAIWEMNLQSPSPETKVESKVQHKESNQGEQYLFKDPKEYENLTPEERKAKTDVMLKYWKGMILPGGAIR